MDRKQELAAKHQRVVAYMQATGLDAVLLAKRCNFSWYTGGAHNYVSNACEIGNSYLLIDHDGARVIANNIETPRLADEGLADLPIEVCSFDYANPADQAQLLDKLIGPRHVAVDVPIGGLGLPTLDSAFDKLRLQLLDVEIDRMRDLSRDVVLAVEATCMNIDQGESEHSIAGALACALRGAGMVPWVLLVAGDERLNSFRHPLPTDNKCTQTAMLAVGAERDGLISACTRIVSFTKLSAELRKTHQAVATVDAALWSVTKPGVTLGQAFDEACQAYQQVGYGDQWKFHHQGGSIGYQPRDAKASPNDATPMLDNQAFAWNPSITGTKSEDTILCHGEAPAPLSGPTDWPMIEARWKDYKVRRPDILVR